jgi:hypothetical protein
MILMILIWKWKKLRALEAKTAYFYKENLHHFLKICKTTKNCAKTSNKVQINYQNQNKVIDKAKILKIMNS